MQLIGSRNDEKGRTILKVKFGKFFGRVQEYLCLGPLEWVTYPDREMVSDFLDVQLNTWMKELPLMKKEGLI